MTLDELLAASDEKKAVWVVEKLGIAEMRQYEESVEYIWDAVNFGLGNIVDLTDWLSSPDGLDAIEKNIIEREYNITTSIFCEEQLEAECTIWMPNDIPNDHAYSTGVTKSQAIINAAIKALWRE